MLEGDRGGEALRPRLTKRLFPLKPGGRSGHGLLGRGVRKHITLAVKTILSRVTDDEAG